MVLRFKTNISELQPPLSKEVGVLSSFIQTDENFVINDLIERTLKVKYENSNSFSFQKIFETLAGDITKASAIFITAYTDPSELSLTEPKESVKFDIYQDSKVIAKTSQFSLINLEGLIEDFSIFSLYPTIEDKSIIVKIVIGIK